MRIIISLAILALVVLIGFQLYRLNRQRIQLSERFSSISEQAELLEAENARLTADIEYFSDAKNLIKELKALFNYRKPGEKLFIIVPGNREP